MVINGTILRDFTAFVRIVVLVIPYGLPDLLLGKPIYRTSQCLLNINVIVRYFLSSAQVLQPLPATISLCVPSAGATPSHNHDPGIMHVGLGQLRKLHHF